MTNLAGEMIMEPILICKTCWGLPYITIVVDGTILWFNGETTWIRVIWALSRIPTAH